MQKAVLAQRNSCVFLVCNLKKVLCLLCALILAQFALTRVGYSQIISQYVETESGTRPKGMECSYLFGLAHWGGSGLGLVSLW